jgi:hypothetical protein
MDLMAPLGQAGDLHFQPLDRGIDETHRAAGCAFFTHYMPRLERVSQCQFDTG